MISMVDYILGAESDQFTENLSRLCGVEAKWVKIRLFPDSEVCPRIQNPEGLKGASVVLVFRAESGRIAPSRYLMLYYLTAMNLKEHGVSEVIAVIPYLPYCRQDKRFLPGEPVSLRYVAQLLEASGVDCIVTVSSHVMGTETPLQDYFSVPAIDLDGFKPLAEYLKSMGRSYSNAVVIAPDEKSLRWAEEVRMEINAARAMYIKKTRDLVTGEISITAPGEDLSGLEVIIVDDIASTGGTLVRAASYARSRGASRISLCFIHPVLIGEALPKLVAASDEVIATDTIRSEVSRATVTKLVASTLSRI
ncbi:MAG: hypothetical protein DRN96_01325 [Thermoproteota archaeon]|nr:MAG: hypothetical protein DRN96_01325 [Candidatus Korarchaeota archaeon]RLG56255.1 MAG: hypothetical protein DRN99_00135 [Candidatus Korarchaeota archaeon]